MIVASEDVLNPQPQKHLEAMRGRRNHKSRSQRQVDAPNIHFCAKQCFEERFSARVTDGEELAVAARQETDDFGLSAQLQSGRTRRSPLDCEVVLIIELDLGVS